MYLGFGILRRGRKRMSLFELLADALVNMRKYLKKDGMTDEDINDTFDYAAEFIKKIKPNITQEELDTVIKALKEGKK